MRHHFVKEKVKIRELLPIYIPSEENITDLLTKPLPRDMTRNFIMLLGLYELGKAEEQVEQRWRK